MGEAKLRLMREGQTLRFDFAAPKIRGKADQVAQATRQTIIVALNMKFAQGADRRDGKIVAAWLEQLDDVFDPESDAELTADEIAAITAGNAPPTAQFQRSTAVAMPRGQIDWLYKILAEDSFKMPPGLAGNREAVIEYIDLLRKEPGKEEVS